MKQFLKTTREGLSIFLLTAAAWAILFFIGLCIILFFRSDEGGLYYVSSVFCLFLGGIALIHTRINKNAYDKPKYYISSLKKPLIVVLDTIADMAFYSIIYFCFFGFVIALAYTGYGPAQLFFIFNAKVSGTIFSVCTMLGCLAYDYKSSIRPRFEFV